MNDTAGWFKIEGRRPKAGGGYHPWGHIRSGFMESKEAENLLTDWGRHSQDLTGAFANWQFRLSSK